MATTLLGEGREGDCYLRSNNGIPSYEETWHFIVEASDAFVRRDEVILTDGLPRLNVSGSPSGVGRCRGIRANRRPERVTLWDVTAEFSSEVADAQSGGSNEPTSTNPEEWIPIYETKFERLQEIVTKDFAGTAIANSAGQPFQTGMTRGRYIPVWEFFQLEPASIGDEFVLSRTEVTNSATFRGRSDGTLLLVVLSSAIGYYYGEQRRLTRYSMKYNYAGWKHKRLDVGTVYLDSGVLKPYTDDGGNVILGALDGSGGKVTAGSPPAVKEFDQFGELDFNTFLRV